MVLENSDLLEAINQMLNMGILSNDESDVLQQKVIEHILNNKLQKLSELESLISEKMKKQFRFDIDMEKFGL